jgi:hypothetical protein
MVALGSAVYLWNAGTGNIEVLFENDNVGRMLVPCPGSKRDTL